MTLPSLTTQASFATVCTKNWSWLTHITAPLNFWTLSARADTDSKSRLLVYLIETNILVSDREWEKLGLGTRNNLTGSSNTDNEENMAEKWVRGYQQSVSFHNTSANSCMNSRQSTYLKHEAGHKILRQGQHGSVVHRSRLMLECFEDPSHLHS